MATGVSLDFLLSLCLIISWSFLSWFSHPSLWGFSFSWSGRGFVCSFLSEWRQSSWLQLWHVLTRHHFTTDLSQKTKCLQRLGSCAWHGFSMIPALLCQCEPIPTFFFPNAGHPRCNRLMYSSLLLFISYLPSPSVSVLHIISLSFTSLCLWWILVDWLLRLSFIDTQLVAYHHFPLYLPAFS